MIWLLASLCLVHPPQQQDGCWCERIKPTPGGWCQACSKGYIAGRKVDCALLVDAIDTHGHEVTLKGLECSNCRSAYATRGLCRTCAWGFVGTKLYFTPLTWALARGTYEDPARITCTACRKFVEQGGWCATCHRGRVGHFVWTDREIYRVARAHYTRLLEACKTCQRCSECAVAQYFGSTCTTCRKTYTAPATAPKPAATRP